MQSDPKPVLLSAQQRYQITFSENIAIPFTKRETIYRFNKKNTRNSPAYQKGSMAPPTDHHQKPVNITVSS